MGSEIGIDLRVNAQTDGLRQAGQDFDKFADKIGGVLGITDPENIEQFWEKYNSGLEKAVSMFDKLSILGRRSGGEGQGAPAGGEGQGAPAGGGNPGDGGRAGGGGNVLQFPGRNMIRFERSMKGAISGVSRDAGGAAVSAGEGIVDKLGSLWHQMPMAAKAATTVVAAGVAAAAITNELSKQYEAVAPTVMSATSSLGRFGATAKEQSALFRSTMKEISGVSAEYGYTLQQGAAVVETLMRSGARDGTAGQRTVLEYAKGYGFSEVPSEMTELYALASRFGGSGKDALSLASGGARATVGDARIQDYINATTLIFQDGLSDGIVKGFDEISKSQNFLYGVFGEMAAGQRGADVYSKLSSGVSGATGLQNETDLMLFRASRDIGVPGEDYIDTFARLEGGFTTELFKEFKNSISDLTRTNQIELIRQAFGTNYTQAIALYESKNDQDAEEAIRGRAPGAAIKGTSESQIVGAQERIAEGVREVGAGALDVKNMTLSGVGDFVDILTGKKKIDDFIKITQADINTANALITAQSVVIEAGMGNVSDEFYDNAGTESGRKFGLIALVENFMKSLEGNPLAKDLGSGFSNTVNNSTRANDIRIKSILSDKKNLEAFQKMDEGTRQSLLDTNKLDSGDWTVRERDALLEGLIKALGDNTAATEKASKDTTIILQGSR